jgi:uncharacterized membrane protein YhaH (DUF805 family)
MIETIQWVAGIVFVAFILFKIVMIVMIVTNCNFERCWGENPKWFQ